MVTSLPSYAFGNTGHVLFAVHMSPLFQISSRTETTFKCARYDEAADRGTFVVYIVLNLANMITEGA